MLPVWMVKQWSAITGTKHTKEIFMSEELMNLRVSPASKKNFVEVYDMENKEGDLIQYWIVWKSGSVILHDVPVSEYVLYKMGEAEELPDQELETAYCGFETEFEGSWDACDFGYEAYDCKAEIQNLDNTFYDSEELQEEYFDFLEYLESIGFTIVQYNVVLDGELIYEPT